MYWNVFIGNDNVIGNSTSGGGGGFFSGLGGKPSADKAAQNVFGGGATFASPSSSGKNHRQMISVSNAS